MIRLSETQKIVYPLNTLETAFREVQTKINQLRTQIKIYDYQIETAKIYKNQQQIELEDYLETRANLESIVDLLKNARLKRGKIKKIEFEESSDPTTTSPAVAFCARCKWVVKPSWDYCPHCGCRLNDKPLTNIPVTVAEITYIMDCIEEENYDFATQRLSKWVEKKRK